MSNFKSKLNKTKEVYEDMTLLEKDGECWNWSHSSLYIERFYTKMESL